MRMAMGAALPAKSLTGDDAKLIVAVELNPSSVLTWLMRMGPVMGNVIITDIYSLCVLSKYQLSSEHTITDTTL